MDTQPVRRGHLLTFMHPIIMRMCPKYQCCPCGDYGALSHNAPRLTGAVNASRAVVIASPTHTRERHFKKWVEMPRDRLNEATWCEERLQRRMEKERIFLFSVPHSALIGAFVNNPYVRDRCVGPASPNGNCKPGRPWGEALFPSAKRSTAQDTATRIVRFLFQEEKQEAGLAPDLGPEH